MGAEHYILAIDQGTTSSRAIVFDQSGRSVASAQREFPQYYPGDGWVEHDPEEIWETTLAVCREALERAGGVTLAGIGITNQRETTVLWERDSGRALHRAIVWCDRRTAGRCAELRAEGQEPLVQARTGLLLDPYFSGTKLEWLLNHVPGARERAQRGELAFGTVDSWLLWRLTGGRVHATDASNASRTLLFNIHTQDWDPELLALFGIPKALLPEVKDSAADYGTTESGHLGQAVAIGGVAGDQQAAGFGQTCFEPGMIKSTYGTGCFLLMNTGTEVVSSKHQLLSTVAYRLEGQPSYAVEGSLFVAGSMIQWLRDRLELIAAAPETEALAAGLDSNRGVYLVPAFTGLGAPHWDPHARAAIFGMSLDTGKAELVRAALEAVCYQTRELLDAMEADGSVPPAALRVDGGMAANSWMLGFLADVCGVPVQRPRVIETTALGAAYLAGLQAGLYQGLDELVGQWACERTFEPRLAEDRRRQLLGDWARAVGLVRAMAPGG